MPSTPASAPDHAGASHPASREPLAPSIAGLMLLGLPPCLYQAYPARPAIPATCCGDHPTPTSTQAT